MPDSTPIYGFTYPCSGETVDAAAIALLAGQIDTKLADVNNDLTLALNRFNVDLTGPIQNIPQGVDTPIVNPVYVTPLAGVYAVQFQLFMATTPATINMFRARPRLNGVARFGETTNTEANQSMNPSPTVPMICAAGDTISVTALYSGTGTMDVFCLLSIKMLCRIP